jgi:hypothetical protein
MLRLKVGFRQALNKLIDSYAMLKSTANFCCTSKRFFISDFKFIASANTVMTLKILLRISFAFNYSGVGFFSIFYVEINNLIV